MLTNKFTKSDLKDITRSKNYICPFCGSDEHCEYEEGYVIDKKHYPIYYNETKGYNGDTNYWDWDELHKCLKCKKEFYYSNGAY